MFFLLAKIIGFITLPSNVIAIVCGLGLCLLLLKRHRAGASLLTVGIVSLLVFGYSPAGNVLLLTLSDRFPAWQYDGRDPAGIIVLGGAIDPGISAARGAVETNGSAERVIAALELARRFPGARIVYSSGSGNLIADFVPEAPIAGRLLETLGISPERIVLESGSRTTYENARFTSKLISPKPGERWLLVTSAYHMPRSIGVFRKAGFDVEAYPVDWRTRGWVDASRPFGRLSAGLASSDTAVHEWVGLIAYWLAGRSDRLLPAPRPP
ncbi:MAG: YdcF family protein [Nitrobacter sp.]|jgi:uncharacterized SAM-binding protein YcdF (DUF218 family)